MGISSISYINAGSAISVLMDDGTILFDDAQLPADTRMRTEIALWFAGGGVIEPYLAPEPPVPDITRRQLRLWLVRNGVALASVEAAIDGMPEPARTEAQIEWADASLYSLSNPLVAQIGASVGLTDIEALKQAFRDAALI